MKVTGSLFPRPEEDSDNPSSSKHYICCVLNVYSNTSPDSPQNAGNNTKIRRRYSGKSIASVTGLSVIQIILGLLIVGCQIAPSYWQFKVASFDKISFSLEHNAADILLPGVWSGLAIFATGIVGLIAARKNVRCLILAHLVMNAVVVILAVTLVVMCIISFSTLINCRVYGSWVNTWASSSHNNDRNYDWRRTTTPRPIPTIDVFGERFKVDVDYYDYNQRLYCRHSIFTVWLVSEMAMIVMALLAFGLTIALLVKNSKALCLCCRSCCALDDGDKEDADDVPIVST